MTPKQKEIVRSTWRSVTPIAHVAADLFYEKLFELDPSLKGHFDGVDLAAQKAKLLKALTATVESLHALDELAPVLRELGCRHAGYGVVAVHYETVGRALLWALEQGLRDQWTLETRNAWAAAYGLVSQTMQAGAVHAPRLRNRAACAVA